jgi:hypothetical protein
MNEHEFITQQANDARAAIDITLERLKRQAGDPRQWVRSHPLAAVATAATAGFAASLVASRQRPIYHPDDEPQATERGGPPGETSHHRLQTIWIIAKAVFPLIRPFLSTLAAMYAPPPEAPQSNGDPAPQSSREA